MATYTFVQTFTVLSTTYQLTWKLDFLNATGLQQEINDFIQFQQKDLLSGENVRLSFNYALVLIPHSKPHAYALYQGGTHSMSINKRQLQTMTLKVTNDEHRLLYTHAFKTYKGSKS